MCYLNSGRAAKAREAADYDDDGFADIAVYRPDDANWYFWYSSLGVNQIKFGLKGDIPVISTVNP